MRFLICGDVMGRSGRDVVLQNLPSIKKRFNIDFTIVNVDNAAHGFGIIPDMARQFWECGIDVLTGGNHIFDQKEALGLLESEKRLLRPANMSDAVPGNGVIEATAAGGQKVVVIHLIGQLNMPIIGGNPFCYMDKLLSKYQINRNVHAIIVDFHAETTSEKNALGCYLDGRVSVVIGTHTHIPTADERILEYGTAYQTDVGMCGDYNSVIGMQKTIAERFVNGYSYKKVSPSSGEATL
ncbi:MAG: TIGR00282 family metallophosphoesterase, partial [Holosporaceae bacterium]|nr:TIGR00282 family metallophosphoesterase [Holosporaceae bacterium]